MLISEQYLKEREFTSQEIRVLFFRYSKEGVKIRTQEEVGRKLKLKRQRIQQIEQKAISKLPPEIREQLVGSLRPPTLKEMEVIERRFSAKGHSYQRIANEFSLSGHDVVGGRIQRGLKKIESREKAGVLSKREIKILEKAEELTGESSIIQANRLLGSLLISREAKKRYEQMGPTDVEKIAKKTEKSDQWVYWAIKKLVEERGFSPPERKRGFGEARIVLSDEMKRALLQLPREQNQS